MSLLSLMKIADKTFPEAIKDLAEKTELFCRRCFPVKKAGKRIH